MDEKAIITDDNELLKQLLAASNSAAKIKELAENKKEKRWTVGALDVSKKVGANMLTVGKYFLLASVLIPLLTAGISGLKNETMTKNLRDGLLQMDAVKLKQAWETQRYEMKQQLFDQQIVLSKLSQNGLVNWCLMPAKKVVAYTAQSDLLNNADQSQLANQIKAQGGIDHVLVNKYWDTKGENGSHVAIALKNELITDNGTYQKPTVVGMVIEQTIQQPEKTMSQALIDLLKEQSKEKKNNANAIISTDLLQKQSQEQIDLLMSYLNKNKVGVLESNKSIVNNFTVWHELQHVKQHRMQTLLGQEHDNFAQEKVSEKAIGMPFLLIMSPFKNPAMKAFESWLQETNADISALMKMQESSNQVNTSNALIYKRFISHGALINAVMSISAQLLEQDDLNDQRLVGLEVMNQSGVEPEDLVKLLKEQVRQESVQAKLIKEHYLNDLKDPIFNDVYWNVPFAESHNTAPLILHWKSLMDGGLDAKQAILQTMQDVMYNGLTYKQRHQRLVEGLMVAKMNPHLVDRQSEKQLVALPKITYLKQLTQLEPEDWQALLDMKSPEHAKVLSQLNETLRRPAHNQGIVSDMQNYKIKADLILRQMQMLSAKNPEDWVLEQNEKVIEYLATNMTNSLHELSATRLLATLITTEKLTEPIINQLSKAMQSNTLTGSLKEKKHFKVKP